MFHLGMENIRGGRVCVCSSGGGPVKKNVLTHWPDLTCDSSFLVLSGNTEPGLGGVKQGCSTVKKLS